MLAGAAVCKMYIYNRRQSGGARQIKSCGGLGISRMKVKQVLVEEVFQQVKTALHVLSDPPSLRRVNPGIERSVNDNRISNILFLEAIWEVLAISI